MNLDTIGGHKLDHLAINSTRVVAAEVRVNPAYPATAVVEFMTKWLNLYLRTVIFGMRKYLPTNTEHHLLTESYQDRFRNI